MMTARSVGLDMDRTSLRLRRRPYPRPASTRAGNRPRRQNAIDFQISSGKALRGVYAALISTRLAPDAAAIGTVMWRIPFCDVFGIDARKRRGNRERAVLLAQLHRRRPHEFLLGPQPVAERVAPAVVPTKHAVRPARDALMTMNWSGIMEVPSTKTVRGLPPLIFTTTSSLSGLSAINQRVVRGWSGEPSALALEGKL